MFHSRASMRELASLSRNLGVSLHSGISIVKSFQLAANKTDGRMRRVIDDVIAQLKLGSDVASAIESHGDFFPRLFVDMIQVGESTGALPEVLRSLASHYENNIRLRKEFLGEITFPVVELVSAILIIAGLIFVLGWVAELTGQTVDILGWGLLGSSGALIWLGGWIMLIVAAIVGYRLMSTSLSNRAAVDRLILTIPVMGTCARSFAIARFSWAFHLTQNAGMRIAESLDASFRATANGAFYAASSHVIADISSGETLSDAFERTQLFPREFIEYVMVAEHSGTVPEALDRMSPQFEEDARRSLKAMAMAFSWLVRGAVAAFIAFIIFTIALWYIGLINDAVQQAM